MHRWIAKLFDNPFIIKAETRNMLGFLISTIAFSLAAYGLNRYFDNQESNNIRSRKMLVMTAATFISMGAGWAVDKLDGDAESSRESASIVSVIQSGDPVQIAKLLVGIN